MRLLMLIWPVYSHSHQQIRGSVNVHFCVLPWGQTGLVLFMKTLPPTGLPGAT